MTDSSIPPRTGRLALTPWSAPRAAADLAARGYVVGRVDAHDKAELLHRLQDALRLPEWYGRNLDALWDCLTDLTAPTAVVWTGWEDFAVGHPDDWAAVIGLLADRARAEPAFTVLLAPSRASGDPAPDRPARRAWPPPAG